jgi:hypothetical protein
MVASIQLDKDNRGGGIRLRMASARTSASDTGAPDLGKHGPHLGIDFRDITGR